MKLKIYREFGALNSEPIFNAVESGIKRIGWQLCNDNEDIPVIWSVLWGGRMRNNQVVYNQARFKNKPVLIVEVGNLKRNETWRISLNHINNLGEFANDTNLDELRPEKLGIFLNDRNENRKNKILIATQHKLSLQWQGQKSMEDWTEDKIKEIRQFSDRPVIIRPHPRSPFVRNIVGADLELPKKIKDTYDDFDIDYNYHCVINFNSGPAVQAAIKGTPIICDRTSLAFPVSDTIENIEKVTLPDRQDWFLKLCHTEWTVEEIFKGIPFARLKEKFDLL